MAIPPHQLVAHAASVYFNGYGVDSYTTYGPNAAVTISGDLAGGCLSRFAFGQYSANVYVVPHGSVDAATRTQMAAQPDAVITSSLQGGLFDGETIGFTAPTGRLSTGNYDIVLDLCTDGFYDPGTDLVAGADSPRGAFSVTVPTNVPLLPLADILSIKSNAKLQADSWLKSAKASAALFALYDIYQIVQSLTGSPAQVAVNFYLDWVCSALPPNPNGAPITVYCPTVGWADILRLQAGAVRQQVLQAAHYSAIANDPIDPNYKALVTLDPIQFSVPNSAEPVEVAFTGMSNQVGTESSTLSALVRSMEKYQGAQQAGDAAAALVQAKSVQQFANMLATSVSVTNASLGNVATAINNSGRDFVSESNTLASLRQRLAISGFTSDEISALHGSGLNAIDIANLRSILTDTASTDPAANYTLDAYQTYGSVPNIVAGLQTQNLNVAQAAGQLATDMQPIIASLSAKIAASNSPMATSGGPYNGAVGKSITFSATGSTTPSATGPLSYAWDLNGNGTFTDATGASPSFTYSAPYSGFVGVEVTSAAGQSAAAYSAATIVASNQRPVISAISPTGPVVDISSGSSQTFSGTATDAEGDPLSYVWRYDGAVAAITQTYTRAFGPGDTGLHVVQLEVSDPGGTALRRLGVLVLPPPRSLIGITVAPPNSTIRIGASQQFTVTGTYSDGSIADLTSNVTWNTSASGIASAGPTGLINGVVAGTATITASISTPTGTLRGTAGVTVVAAPVPLTGVTMLPVNPTIQLGLTRQFILTGTYADGSTADLTGTAMWSSSSPAVAKISSTGLATAVAFGNTTITAAAGGLAASTILTIPSPIPVPTLTSISITPSNITIAVGRGIPFTATGKYSDGSTADLTTGVTWGSSPPSVATITTGGLLQSVAVGTATITATQGAITGSTSLTVIALPAQQGVLDVYVGYVDNLRANPTNFPTPWAGSPGVTFEGCQPTSTCTYDASAVRIVNNTTSSHTVNSVAVRVDTCTYSGWLGATLAPGQQLIVTQMMSGAASGCTGTSTQPGPAIMDTSDVGPNGSGYAFNCGVDGIIPQVDVRVDNSTTTYVDVGQVINTGGYDLAGCPFGTNESIQWTLIGTAKPCTASSLSLAPTSQSLNVGNQATLTAAFANSCGQPLSNVAVHFSVTAGPNSALSGAAVTDANGQATFQYTSRQVGPDVVQASITNPAGAITSSPVSVTWVGTATAATTITYTGPTSGDYHDFITPSAKVSETTTGAMVSRGTVTFTLGDQSCTATTDSTGFASCSVEVTGVPTNTTIGVTFGGTPSDQSSKTTAAFVITAEQTTVVPTGPSVVLRGSPATLEAILLEDISTPIAGRTLILSLGSGSGAQTCIATTDLSGLAACTIASVIQPLGLSQLTARFAGDYAYLSNSNTMSVSTNAPTAISYIGDPASEHADAATAAVQLVDTSLFPPRPIAGKAVVIRLGSQMCGGFTDAGGQASCSVIPSEPAGATSLNASFAGDAGYLPSTTDGVFVVTHEETHIAYLGARLISAGLTVKLASRLSFDGTTALPGRFVTMTLGSGASAQSCIATTDSNGGASCAISQVAQPTGPGIVESTFAGDAAFAPAIARVSTVIFAFASQGSFAIGNESAVAGLKVTFWGAQWASANRLSGGAAPSAFKGFVATPSGSPLVPGQSWSTTPGNSSDPPSEVPAYLAVIVTSHVAKSGDVIGGDITAIAVVRVDSGYGPAPGHLGSGTIVAVVPPR